MNETSESELPAKVTAVLDKHRDHYWQDMDHDVSDCMTELALHSPEAFDGYATFRKALLAPDSEIEPDHLALKFRQLVLVVTDCVIGNLDGAKAHAFAAMKAGLTIEELSDAMAQLLIGCGAPAWCGYGLPVIKAARERMQE
jgi:alkylhydroperoxidase/carboxymuconolactone decarboxylase family protein YurZ